MQDGPDESFGRAAFDRDLDFECMWFAIAIVAAAVIYGIVNCVGVFECCGLILYSLANPTSTLLVQGQNLVAFRLGGELHHDGTIGFFAIDDTPDANWRVLVDEIAPAHKSLGEVADQHTPERQRMKNSRAIRRGTPPVSDDGNPSIAAARWIPGLMLLLWFFHWFLLFFFFLLLLRMI